MHNQSVKLGSREIHSASTPYVIAEIGVNHGGSLEVAKKLIDQCKEGGADAVKFQTYKAEKIASRFSPSYWDTTKETCTSQFELFKRYDGFGPQDYMDLAAHAKKVGIDFLSTPFDAEAVDFLDPLMPFYKVASADLTNVPMLRQIAGKKKPIVISTGAATLSEVEMALQTLKTAGAQQIVLLHCVLNYPTENKVAHLGMISGLRRAFPEHLVGYSDHTLPDDKMLVLTTAWLKGAVVLEKHFTHDKTLPGNDHYHAMDVNDLRKFVDNVRFISEVLGPTESKTYLPSELPARKNARRSIVAVRNLEAGETVTEAMITYKRPAHGISPQHWDEVLGMKLTRPVEEDKPLQWVDLT